MSEEVREITENALSKINENLVEGYFIMKTPSGQFVGLNQLELVDALVNQGLEGSYFNYREVDEDEFQELIDDGAETFAVVGLENRSFQFDISSIKEVDLEASGTDLSKYEEEIKQEKGLKQTAILYLWEITDDKVESFLDHADLGPLNQMLNALPSGTIYMQSRDIISGDLFRNQVLTNVNRVNSYKEILSPHASSYASPVPSTVSKYTYTLDVLTPLLEGDDVYALSMVYDGNDSKQIALEGSREDLLEKIENIITQLGHTSAVRFTNFISMKGFNNTSISFDEVRTAIIIDSINEVFEYLDILTEE